MGHGHHHHHSTDNSDSVGNIKVAFALNLGFSIIEIVGGLLTNSLAVLSDALHDLGDSLSLGISWYFQHVSQRGSDTSYSYGYRRFSLIGAFVNSIILIGGSVFILSKAIPGIFNPEQAHAEGMFAMAILGILVNGAAALRLKKGHSINEKVVSLHLLEDVLGWAAVLIASVVMMFADLPVLDPALSALIACYVLYNAFRNVRQSISIALQGVPANVDLEAIKSKLATIDGVVNIHDVHVWTMDGEYNILTAHIVCEQNKRLEDLMQLKREARSLLKDEHIHHLTVEFETVSEDCEYADCQ